MGPDPPPAAGLLPPAACRPPPAATTATRRRTLSASLRRDRQLLPAAARAAAAFRALTATRPASADVAAKTEALGKSDAVILCLPDDAAKQTVALLDAAGNTKTVVIDASTAHRTDPDWDYGFPEVGQGVFSSLTAPAAAASHQ